jgi:uncharacterized membrane protein
MFNLTNIWAKLHGGVTHFPIALLAVSFLFDLTACMIKKETQSRELHAAGYYTMLLAALASIAAGLTGLLLTHWDAWGSGRLLAHHQFAYPAFGLTVGLAVWRLVVKNEYTRIGFGIYLLIAAVAALLMLITGYWGGEMVL